MGKVHLMDEVLANKIAAGEVVEKCMNVVKELVENSIDAHADDIKIELLDSGVKMIRVIDNGVGMEKEDAVLAFSRHATSKLLDEEDLFNISSLGFRGEALPSIASVSIVELKTSDGTNGTFVSIDGGKIKSIENSDLRKGTAITVKNLFYNTPVRLKYLKNLYVELANIVEYVNKMALSYPNIKFRLSNNEKILLSTDGSGNLLKVINQIYGLTITKKMMEVEAENDDYKITGYISYPEITRSNKNSITTFVNGRIIKNNILNKTIISSYYMHMAIDKYPVVVLAIEVDPALIDINIHPTKMDIKFSKMDDLLELVKTAIEEKLTRLTLIPEVKKEEFISKEEENKLFENYYKGREEAKREESIPETYDKISLDFSYEVKEPENTAFGHEKEQSPSTVEVSEEKRESRLKKMFPIGAINATYIVAQNEDAMYLIDQHAAHERINYEKMLREMKQEHKKVYDLLIPLSIELTANEYIILKENFDHLTDLGITFEEFGGNTIIIRSVPVWISKDYLDVSIRKIIDIIITTEKFDKEKYIDRVAASVACKMSIKAHDFLEISEMEALLEELGKCENPFNCAHGRPTIITYSLYELDKMFKRILD